MTARGATANKTANMPKAIKTQGASSEEDCPFEEALRKLETIVESMEAGDLPLEVLLDRCEEGARLSKICQAKLAEADVKIRQLEQNAAGELSLKPLTVADETPEA